MHSPSMPSDIERDYLEVASEIASEKASGELVKHPELPTTKEALIELYKAEMQNEFVAFFRRQDSGATKLAHSLSELAQEAPELFTEEVCEGIRKIATISDTLEANSAAYEAHIAEGRTLQEYVGLRNSVINTLYLAAKRLYENKNYEDAADAFFFLAELNPEQHVFWLGLGNSEFHCQNFQQALSVYIKLAEESPKDLSLQLAICRCHEALGYVQQAVNTIDFMLDVIDDSEEYAGWKNRLEEEKTRLEELKDAS